MDTVPFEKNTKCGENLNMRSLLNEQAYSNSEALFKEAVKSSWDEHNCKQYETMYSTLVLFVSLLYYDNGCKHEQHVETDDWQPVGVYPSIHHRLPPILRRVAKGLKPIPAFIEQEAL